MSKSMVMIARGLRADPSILRTWILLRISGQESTGLLCTMKSCLATSTTRGGVGFGQHTYGPALLYEATASFSGAFTELHSK